MHGSLLQLTLVVAFGQMVLMPETTNAQTVSTVFDGVNNPLRLEFWNEDDGTFDWYGADTRRSAGDWTNAEIQAVERGMQYWLDVLGDNNTAGRTINVRVLRSGQYFDGTNWVTMGSNSSAPGESVGGVEYSIIQQVWAEGQSTASSQVVDTVINFAPANNLTAENGPLQMTPGYSMERVMLHEFAHSLGQTTGNSGEWGPGGELSQFETMVVYYDTNNQLQSVQAGDPFNIDGSDPNFPYYFNGANAVAVFGAPVPLNRESLQASHLWIDPFNMTHLTYRNYPFFSEVELAVIQDLGYNINRSDFFGRSYYVNGTDSVNNNGFNSAMTYGVGLHVKGNDMTILQTADLNATGTAGNGIRIDGVNNVVTIDEGVRISTPGQNGVGVLVSNGYGNVVIHRGEIESGDIDNGITGTGILIDFGFNSTGGAARTSGTQVNYRLDGTLQNGYLVDRLDISGSIAANQGHAIEISERAAVREINILQGAQIDGFILSNALTGQAFSNPEGSGVFERPTINFGLTADANGARTNTADTNFNFVYDGFIGGSTVMNANFWGGQDDSVGTQLSGIAIFNDVQIGTQGRLTQLGALGASTFDNYGELGIAEGGSVSAGQFSNSGNSVLDGSQIVAATLFSNFGTITSSNGSTARLTSGSIGLATGSQFINDESTLQALDGNINIFGVLGGRDGTVFASGNVTVVDGGRLQGTPTITAMLVDNQAGGTMAAGNSIGTMTIDAAYQTNGDIEFEITAQSLPQDSDLIDVVNNNVAVINNMTDYADRGTFHFDAEPGDYDIARRYTIIQTDSPGNLLVVQRPQTTDNLADQRIILRSDTDRSMLYTPDAQSYYAYVGRDVSYAQIGQTANQQAVGAYLDSIVTLDDGSMVGDQIQWLRDTLDLIVDEADVRTALTQMAGGAYGDVTPMLIQQSYANYSRMAANFRSNPMICDAASLENSDGWYGSVTGFGTGGEVYGNQNTPGYDYTAGGVQVTAGIGRGRAELGGFYNYTNGQLKGLGRSNVEINEFGGFAFLSENDNHLLLAAGGGYATYGVSRSFSFGNTDIQDAISFQGSDNVGVGLASVYSELGHEFAFYRSALRPFAGLAYNYVQGAEFSEAGNVLALNGSIDSLDSFRSILGTDLSFCLDEASATVLDLRAMWMHEFLNNQAATVTSGFGNGVGGTYVLQGTSLGRNFAFLGANLSRVFWDGHARVYGGYDLILNDKQALNTGSGGLEFYW